MSPSENDPHPRRSRRGGPAETATPDTNASKETIARPPKDGRSESQRTTRGLRWRRTRNNLSRPSSPPTRSGPTGSGSPTLAPSHRHCRRRGGRSRVATKLGDSLGRRKKAQITLVERARTHIWKPHLHEVAAGTMDVGRDAVDYLAQASDHHFRYRIGEMVGLDRAHREVHLAPSHDAEGHEVTPARAVPYDTLVIAVGSTSNDFGTPGARSSRSPSIRRMRRYDFISGS